MGRMYHRMGRFVVPRWVYDVSPRWAHCAADYLGGVYPNPWRELWEKMRHGREQE